MHPAFSVRENIATELERMLCSGPLGVYWDAAARESRYAPLGTEVPPGFVKVGEARSIRDFTVTR